MLMYEYITKFPGVVTDEFIILVLGCENTANTHAMPSDYAFKEGDIILLDFCAYYKHYWSDITRCLFLGNVGNKKLALRFMKLYWVQTLLLSKRLNQV